MSRRADIVVIGAGIIGLNIAWQLARRSPLKILVLERGAGTGEGSTGASSAVCRHRYSLDAMVQFARDGITAYRAWQQYTGLATPRASFHQHGVLWIPEDPAWAAREQQRLQAVGLRAEVLDSVHLAQRFAPLSPCTRAPDLVTGEPHPCDSGGRYLLEPEGGYMEPVACTDDLVEACRGAGVTVAFQSPVAEVLLQGGQVRGLRLASGERVDSPCVISAGGPWCGDLLATLPLELPWRLRPTRIQMAVLSRPPELAGDIPVTVDMAAGIYFRTQNRGQQLVVGSVLEEDERERVPDPDQFDRIPDPGFLQAKLHALHHRLPDLPYRGRVTGYCGLYTVNEQDMHPLIGPCDIEGLYLALGFSGHGFKLAPAVGALLARMIAGPAPEFDTAVDPAFFSVNRQPIGLASKNVLA